MSACWHSGITVCVLVLAGMSLGCAQTAQNSMFSFKPGEAGMAGWELLEPINALGPIEPNGQWRVENGEIIAEGLDLPWTIQVAGEESWCDYRLSVDVTIRKPTPYVEHPICFTQWDSYRPRPDAPLSGSHTGQYRYRYYAGEFDWGSDAAVFVRYTSRWDCYRVQLSTEYQEMILWHGIGGYLQVVPCKLEPGRTYRLEVIAHGAHLQAFLDGEKKIDYWHRCLPTLSGKIGLGAYNATVAFGDVNVTEITEEAPPMPHYQPSFHTRHWRGPRWIFDGGEPICCMEKEHSGRDHYSSKTLFITHVKLRPGYRALYNTWVGVKTLTTPHITQLQGEVDDIKTTGEGAERLVLEFDLETPEHTIRTHHTDVLTYDRVRGTYRHDITANVTFLADMSVRTMEFTDPLTYNNKVPGRGVRYGWLPAGHEWGIFVGEDGRVYRHPISQSLNLPYQNKWHTQRDSNFWLLYPDRAVCPLFEHNVEGAQSEIGVCHWGYDFHQRALWKPDRNFKADEGLKLRYALTGCPPQEGERLFLSSTLHPQNDLPEDHHKGSHFLVVPSFFAFPVCDPAGTSFDELHNTRVPYVGWQFVGDYDVDRTVGRTDHYSLRLHGPAKASGMFYHHMIDGHTDKYLCTFWVKTEDVTGRGVVAKLTYAYRGEPCDVIETGLTGDNDWREFSFVTSVPSVEGGGYDSSTFVLQLDGTGTVWLDDFSVRPIEKRETVVEKLPDREVKLPAPSKDYLVYLKCDEGEGVGCFDASNHGHSAKLHGVEWIETDGRAALRFDGQAAAFVPALSGELQQVANETRYPLPGLTVDAWVRPAAGGGGGAIIGYFNSPYLSLRPAEDDTFRLQFQAASNRVFSQMQSAPIVPAGKWTHVAATVDAENLARIYVNGKPAGEEALPGRIDYRSYFQAISIGTHGKSLGRHYTGDMAEIRWWSRAATAREMAAAAAQGHP